MRVGLRHCLGLAVLLSRLAWAPTAQAEQDAATRAAARKLAEDGVAALQAGDAKTASQKLDKAFRMLMVPSVGLWSGRALVKQGLLIEAMERFLEATRLPSSGDVALQDRAKVDAEKEIEQLRPRIPHLVVALEGAREGEVTLTLDGRAVPTALVGEDMPVNPGAHRLVGKRGAEEQAADVTIAEAERKPVSLRFSGAPVSSGAATPAGPALAIGESTASEPSDRGGRDIKRPLAYVALALGGAGLVAGGVTGGLALSKRSELDESGSCAGGKCTYGVEGDVKSLRTFRTISTVSFIAGGALAGAGVVLLLTAKDSQQSALALGVGVGNMQLTGSF